MQYLLTTCCTVFLLLVLLLRHVSVTALGHLQGARKFIDVCSLCVNLCGTDSTHQGPNIIKIIIQIKILKPLKSVYG